MTVRALIFDMDGTMIDSMPYHQQSWVLFAKRHGIEMDLPEMMRRTTGRTGTECMGELFGRTMTHAEALPFVHEKEAIYRELFGPVFKEVAGFKAFMHQAHLRGFKIGVGTAGDKPNIEFAFGNLQMPVTPQVVVGGDEGLAGKPDPAIFLEAARRLGVEPAHCLVFEDAPFGIEAASRAGMRAVAITTSHTQQELLGEHVLTAVPNYEQLMNSHFLEQLVSIH